MRKIIKMWVLPIAMIFTLAACSNDYSLGAADTVSVDQITFTYEISESSDNVITLTNTTDLGHPYVAIWDLGNGSTSQSTTVEAQYPFKGDYTVALTIYTASGTQATKSQVISFTDDDYDLLDTPTFNYLTGGLDQGNGVTWVLDQYNNYTDEVKSAVGTTISGHMGIGSLTSYSQEWWGASSDEKSSWGIYDITYHFALNSSDGTALTITTSGTGSGRSASSASVGGYSVTSTDGDDVLFTYNGGDYTYVINESGTYPLLTLTTDSYIGHYCGTQEYEIIYLTADVMALRVASSEEHDWIFILCREELNVDPS